MVFLWFSYGFPVVFVAFTHQLEDFQPPRTRLVREDPEPEPAKPKKRLGFSHRGRRMAASKLLVGGLEHFEFSHILGSSSSQMTYIFQRDWNHQLGCSVWERISVHWFSGFWDILLFLHGRIISLWFGRSDRNSLKTCHWHICSLPRRCQLFFPKFSGARILGTLLG